MKRILIVEDSPAMRALLVTTVESCGDFDIIEAYNGFMALRLLPRAQADLIITDINMPDINGLELISCVRTNPQYCSIPLFIISTEGGGRDMEKGLALWANEYLVKPFDPERLQSLILQYLG